MEWILNIWKKITIRNLILKGLYCTWYTYYNLIITIHLLSLIMSANKKENIRNLTLCLHLIHIFLWNLIFQNLFWVALNINHWISINVIEVISISKIFVLHREGEFHSKLKEADDFFRKYDMCLKLIQIIFFKKRFRIREYNAWFLFCISSIVYDSTDNT